MTDEFNDGRPWKGRRDAQDDRADAARFRWLLREAPGSLAAIAYSFWEAGRLQDPVEAIDAAMRHQEQGQPEAAPGLLEALRELHQSAGYVFRHHENQITGTLKLSADLKRAADFIAKADGA